MTIFSHHWTTRAARAASIVVAVAAAMTQVGAAPDAAAAGQSHPDPMSWIMSEDFPDICVWPDLVAAVGLSDLCPVVDPTPSTTGI